MRQNVVIGPAGWNHRDWRGKVYPAAQASRFHELEYLSEFVPLVEINSSFYRPIRTESAKIWLDRVQGRRDFRFTSKLYRAFTHERRWSRQDVLAVHAGLNPLQQAGCLGGLLLQFPQSFARTAENERHVLALAGLFERYPLAAEFRHASWNNAEPLAILAQNGIGFCNVDQPQLGHAMPPTAIVTADIAYVRLHGRNYEGWYSLAGASQPGPQQTARYDYLYSEQQLAVWSRRIEHLSTRAKQVYVVMNNHFEGQSLLNALQLRQLLSGEGVAVPEPLMDAYPEAYELATNRRRQGRLFELARPTSHRLAS